MFENVTHRAAKDDAYHSMPGWSVSQWKKLPHDPGSFYGYHVADPRTWIFETTPAMEFGTLVHSVLLEKQSFACPPPEYLAPNGHRRGKAWDAYESLHTPLECLSAKEAKALRDIQTAANSDPKVRWLLDAPGEVEYSLFGTHAETGLSIRGRLDKWVESENGRLIVDVKTISADPTNERLVAAQCLNFGYHQQAAAYLDMMAAHGKPCDAFVFLFVKTSPPYTCCLWVLNENDIELGRRCNRLALRDLSRRLDSGDWTGPRHGQINCCAFPKYAYEGDTFVGDEMTANFEAFTEFSESFNQGK